MLPAHIAAQSGNGVTFVSPSMGEVVRPGEAVPFELSVDPSLNAEEMVILPPFQGPLEPVPPPYETTVTIPQDEGGDMTFIGYVQNSADPLIAWTEVSISVVPEAAPTEMRLDNDFEIFELPSSRPRQILGLLRYPDGHWRSLKYPAYGATYSTDDPDVVAVDSGGMLTPVGPGRAFITVQVGSLTDWVSVLVWDLETPANPPIDQTPNVTFAASGFRVDPSNGHIFQTVVISNPTASPIFSPLVLVLENLPDSVQLANSKGETKHIAPAGLPYVFVPVEGGMFRPGATTELSLEFFSPYGVPVSYDAKVYTAAVGER